MVEMVLNLGNKNQRKTRFMSNKNNHRKNKGFILIPEKGTILPTEEAFEDIPKDILTNLDILIESINQKHHKLDLKELGFLRSRIGIHKEESGVRKVVGTVLYNLRKDFLFAQGKEKIRLR